MGHMATFASTNKLGKPMSLFRPSQTRLSRLCSPFFLEWRPLQKRKSAEKDGRPVSPQPLGSGKRLILNM